MKKNKKLLCLLLALAMVLSFAACGEKKEEKQEEVALDWPKSPIKVIVPFSAGGGADLMARALQDGISKALGVSVVVEDLAGGSGAIGLAALATSEPDGYTFVLTSVGPVTLVPNSSDVGYTNKEFAPICQIAEVPHVFTVNKSLGVKTFDEYIAYAEKNPGLSYGSPGANLTQHIQIVSMLKNIGKSDLFNHVPYDGGSASVTALLGNHVTASLNVISEAKAYIDSGDLVPLFVTSDERIDGIDCPTSAELNLGISGGLWYGYAAPAGTDERILDKMGEVINNLLQQDDIKQVFANLGNPISFMDRVSFTDKWMTQFETNKAIIQGK